MVEYIKIWNKTKKYLDRENNLDHLASQPIQICYKMTKKRPCTQSGFTKKELWNENLVKKRTNTQKIELRQVPVETNIHRPAFKKQLMCTNVTV